MASTLPVQACVKSISLLVKHLAPPPILFLFLLLLLSLLLALTLLHINDLFTHTLSNPPLFHFLSPLLLDNKQGFLSLLLRIQQHHIAFLLSPCPIFILANFIIFTLILKSFYLSSSSSSSSPLLDCSDFASEQSECDGARLPEHVVPSHEDFFLSSPPYQHYVLSHDPPEEYHVLSFSTDGESTYFTNMQSYNKLNNQWEKVRGPKTMDPAVEKGQSTLAVAAAPATAYNMLTVEQGKVVEKTGALQEGRLDGKASRSVNAAAFALPGSQAVVINIEPPPIRRTRISTPPSHPPAPAPLAPSLHPAKAAPPPSNSSMTMAQHPLPSSPKVKKSLQNSGGFLITANDGRHEASKPLEVEKPAVKHNKPQKKINDQSSMVGSNSDHRFSQQAQVTTALISSSSTNRPQMQRAQSLRSSSKSSSSSSTNIPHMQRAQSLRSNGSPDTIASSSQVPRSPCFSELIDGLSDEDANKCFSDYIAHRFALMKKERDVHST